MSRRAQTGSGRRALRFVLLIGVVNLFADFTYEGGRSIAGPFLGSLGASATIIGLVAGAGEFIGYALRGLTGYLADRSRQYWPMAVLGYAVNQFAIPALALVSSWPLAAGCVIAERTGRAIRKPAMDSMLSHAGKSIGAGWVFGLNEALDQFGATLGPLLVAAIIFAGHDYRTAFGLFFFPALICLGTVLLARWLYPRPHELEGESPEIERVSRLPSSFWTYLCAGALLAAGLADFALIGFHFQKTKTVSPNLIPIYYAVAMASGAVGGVFFGRLFDRFGRAILFVAFLFSAAFAPFVFLGGSRLALLGMILWGIGMAAEGTLLKAMLTQIIASHRRSTVFGVFDTVYGIAWFAGSAIMGALYDKSIGALVLFSVLTQTAAAPLLFFAKSRATN